MDIAELRNKLNNIAAELAEQDVQQEDIAIEEDSYDHISDDGHQIKDVMDYDDDYDGYRSELQTPLGNVYADWDSYGGRGGFSGIRADNKTLEAMVNKIYGEMHDFESMDKMDWPVAVGKAVDKVMSMAKNNPSFMRSESVEEDSVEEVHEEEAVEETVEVPVSALAELMQLAGYENYEDKLAEFANSPIDSQDEPAYMDAEDQMISLSGGLNGPKKMYPAAAGGDNPMDQEPREIEESMGIAEVENKLYKSYRAFLEEAEINQEEE